MENILKVDIAKLKVDELDKPKRHQIDIADVYKRMQYAMYLENQKNYPEEYSEFELTHPDLCFRGVLPTKFTELDEKDKLIKAYEYKIDDNNKGYMKDVTEIRKAEEAVKQAEKEYAAMLKQVIANA
jgi:hypothetical protein